MSLIEYKQQLIPTLKKYFGYDSFRPQQEEIIFSVLEQKDGLVIMPTGGGKSICFQLPSLLFPKTTLVVSPLIALMKDQVDGCNANGIPAAYFNSSQSAEEQQKIISKITKAELKLIYVAPESMPALENIINEHYISCIAIDEAHCISSWGHDFRPSYQQLGFLKKTLPNTPIIALTATADKATRQDIVEQLGIPHAQHFITSFDRKNISLTVRPADGRVDQILSFIAKRPNSSGIIYCLSRKTTEQLVSKLKAKSLKAEAYHAGLSFDERSKVQEDFIFDKTKIVCATVAFGMGIDKSNVRWVIHYNMPKNIEGYYQEIGRAGRDGLNSNALLFHSYADVIQLRKFTEGATNQDVQIAKLERMKQFSESTTCRRKILLSYFGELLAENCGNCDVCKNPPRVFDGTIIAQKALSTIARIKETEAIGVVIDILRGAKNATIIEKGLDKVKTYNIGHDISWKDWQHYIIQLINQGILEISFQNHNALKLTEFSKNVLFNGAKVSLTKPIEIIEKIGNPKTKTIKARKNGGLYERLRQLRQKISLEENIPAYLVFNDATLQEIEAERPQSDTEFLEISGVGQRKLEVYGDLFMNEIKVFNDEKKAKKSDTHKVTYELYQQGLSIDEIAEKRGLKSPTVFSHIAKLYTEGKPINIYDFVSKSEVEAVKKAKVELENPPALKPYFDHFEEQLDYFKIRLGLAVIEKEEK